MTYDLPGVDDDERTDLPVIYAEEPAPPERVDLFAVAGWLVLALVARCWGAS